MTKRTLLEAALVADSLALAPHWIYDPTEIFAKFGVLEGPLKPLPGSYHEAQPLGGQTHYGHQVVLLAETVAAGWSIETFRERQRAFWQTSNSYKDRATKAFLEGDEGVSDDLAGASRAVAVFDLSDENEAVRIASEQAALTHSSQVTEVAASLTRLAFALKRGEVLRTSIESEFSDSQWLTKAREVEHLEPTEALGKLGRDCSIGSALPSLLYLLLRGRSYKETLLENVMAGGDSAARGLLLGGLLAAEQGEGAVPEEWKSKVLAVQ